MPAKVLSVAIVGLDGEQVDVEVDVATGLHAFTIVGLPDTAIKESRDRVSSAIKNSGFKPVNQCGRVTVNMAPADLPKSGPMYDVPIALGVLLATEQLSTDVSDKIFVGELALDGTVRAVSGILPATLFAQQNGFAQIFVPAKNAREASVVDGITVFPVETFAQIVAHLTREQLIEPVAHLKFAPEEVDTLIAVDLRDVKGQENAKRALEIAAAGGHNVLLSGTPGSGKTLMAKAMPGILPQMSFAESLEITKIYSIAGKLAPQTPLLMTRPFRTPHHSASAVSLIGGGTVPRPGEISLSHHGVLFLDEFAEFPKMVLENLRQPLEDGCVTVTRVRGTAQFPAQFILVAAMNPCPCGYATDPERACSCAPSQVARYTQRVSGPIMDRIDLHVTVPRVDIDKLEQVSAGESSSAVRARVESARARQTARFGRAHTNSDMSVAEIAQFCTLDDTAKQLLRTAMTKLNLSARSYHRLIKIARTIADLDGSEEITPAHIAESISYRFEKE